LVRGSPAIVFAPGLQDSLEQATGGVREALDGAPVGAIVQSAQNGRKKPLAAAMDSTMIGQDCIDELAAEIGLRAVAGRALRERRESAQ
jgi:phosphoserine phosphatase